MKTAIYIRVSTQEQAKDGYSLQAQHRKLLAYCEAKSWKVIEIYADEGISGSTLEKRPAATQMLQDAKEHKFEQVLIVKVDRLCRNTRDLLTIVDLLKSLDIGLIALEENLDMNSPSGKMMLTMLGSFAEFERSTITNRMMTGKMQKALNGIKSDHNVKPYAYKFVDGSYVPNEYASNVVLIYNLMIDGMSLSKIYDYCQANVPNPPNNIHEISRILHNKVYCGYLVEHFSKQRFEIKAKNVIPIIDEETFNEVQHIMSKRYSERKKVTADEFIFADVLRCGCCGWRAGSVSTKNKAYQYYRCTGSTSKDCKNKQIFRIENAEKQFLEYMDEFFFELNVKSKEKPKDYSKEIESLENKKKKLVDLYLNELIDFDIYNERLLNINADISKFKALQPKPEKVINYEPIKATFKELWNIMNNHEKRMFITRTFDSIYFENNKVIRVVFK